MDSDPTFTGKTFHPQNPAALLQVLDEVFSYRGDVTLHLRSGERVEGYVFNRDTDASPAYLQMYLPGEVAPRLIRYSEIVAVTYSGEDTASGKSWEAWMSKKESSSKS